MQLYHYKLKFICNLKVMKKRKISITFKNQVHWQTFHAFVIMLIIFSSRNKKKSLYANDWILIAPDVSSSLFYAWSSAHEREIQFNMNWLDRLYHEVH